MTQSIDSLNEKVAIIEARMKSHWALQTDDEFAERYMTKLRNELQVSIIKTAIAAVLLICGSGFMLIKFAVNEQFSSENSKLILKLSQSYNEQVSKTDANFEWRRFHDYGKDFVNLAELYSRSPMDEKLKKKEIHNLLNVAKGHFSQALKLGDRHASTYWELGELNYSYLINNNLKDEVDRLQAVEQYKNAAYRYTDFEISKGWRAEAYFKIGQIYWELQSNKDNNDEVRKDYAKKSKKFLDDAQSEYSKYEELNDDRTRNNIQSVTNLLAEIEKGVI